MAGPVCGQYWSISFKEDAITRGIKEEFIDQLIKEGFDDYNACICLTDDILKEMRFKMGPRGAIKEWVEELKYNHQPREQSESLMSQLTSDASLLSSKTFFPQIAREKHLTSTTIAILTEEDCDTLICVGALEQDNIQELSVPLSQRVLLKRIINETKLAVDVIKVQREHGTSDEQNKAEKPIRKKLKTDRKNLQGHKPTIKDISAWLDTLYDKDSQKVQLHKQKALLEKDGLDGLLKHQTAELAAFMTKPVTIAITGRSGTGKSSLINTLRGLRPSDPDAAGVGVTETTMEVTCYPHPEMKNVMLLDLPGVGTEKFPRDKYLDQVKFKTYDAFIITSTDRFTQDELWLAEEAHKMGSPFYLLRTKIDEHLTNAERDAGGKYSEDDTLDQMRRPIQESLKKGKLPENVFLVSSVFENQRKWDFPKLTTLIIENTPGKNKQPIILAMVSCSKEVIKSKVQELKDRTMGICLKIVASDHEKHAEILQSEMNLYARCLGITEADLRNVDQSKVDAEYQRFIATLAIINTLDGVSFIAYCTLGGSIGVVGGPIGVAVGVAIGAVVGSVAIGIKSFGSWLFSPNREEINAKKAHKFKTFLDDFLTQCERVACALVDAK